MRSITVLFGLSLGLGIAVYGCSSTGEDVAGSGTDPTNPGDPGGSSGGPGGGRGDGGDRSEGGNGPADTGDGGDAPAVPYTDYAINHVMVTGQSNSVANDGKPVLSTTQPFGNLMFDTGVMPMTNCGNEESCYDYQPPSRFVPLVEGDTFWGGDNLVETPSAGIANEIALLATTKYQGKIPGLPANHDVLMTLHGRSGSTYWCLRKGGCNYKVGYLKPFDQAMMEVESAKAIAAGLGKSYVVRAVTAVHGESDEASYAAGSQEFPLDGTDGTPRKLANYADGLLEWQQDYESGVKAITGQKEPVPLFISQISGWNEEVFSQVAQFQYEAHLRAPGKVILVGPAYHLGMSTDCRHFNADGERMLGEYFGKAYARVVLEGRAWEPVHPKTVLRAGTELTVVFHVPAPPLVLDTERVAAIENFGFTFVDAAGVAVPVTNVAVTGPDTVTVTLGADPGANGHLRYAQNQVPKTCIGSPNGARGNLRDSDTTPSQSGYQLFNWSVHFDVAAP
jgi:hypothetical protein